MKKSDRTKKTIIKIDEQEVKTHLGKVVKETVEETLNGMLDAEADALCKAQRYQRSPDRADKRSGYYKRNLETSSGSVELKIPKLRTIPFESAIIERYKRRESSVEESLVEMYLAGVSVRRVEDITEALWGSRVSTGTLSNLNKKVYKKINEWRMIPIEGNYSYVYLDGIYLKRSWAGEIRNVAILVAIGVNQDGFREILGIAEGQKEDIAGWSSFLRYLKDRGLKCPRLFISDKCMGLIESLSQFYPEAKWQRCMVHFYRNVFGAVPKGKVKEVAAMLKAIHAQENKDEAIAKAKIVADKLKQMKLPKAAEIVNQGIFETLTHMDFPSEHWRKIRTNNPLERIMREIRRRTRVVGNFPDGESALMLAAARLRHISTTKWGVKKYLSHTPLEELDKENQIA